MLVNRPGGVIVHRLITFAFLSIVAVSVYGAELPSAAKVEIDALLNTLGTSECQFYRNGSWYSGPKAEDHLKTKLKYMANTGSISSTEAFIAAAATKSSMSGASYQVRCPQQEAQPSSVWLGNELQRIRGNVTK